MRLKHLFILAFVSIVVILPAQTDDYDDLIFNNQVYHDDMASVKIEILGASDYYDEFSATSIAGSSSLFFFPPVIRLFTEDKIKCSFDDLSADARFMKYTLIHCTHDWKPTSTLRTNEYLSRFTSDDIIDYTFSSYTLIPYVSFAFSFPNDNIQITKSGNYLLYVYEDKGGEKIPLFTRRFMVVENLVKLTPAIQQSSNIAERFTHQEITLHLDYNGQRLINPPGNLKVLIMQNERFDNALLLTKPYIIQTTGLQYNERGAITMEGGNEFRTFNIKSLRSPMEGVERIANLNNATHVYLYLEEDRKYKAYSSNIDINGYYFNETIDFSSAAESDYAYVHFRLKYDKALKGNIYVFGELTDWNFLEEAKLNYVENAGYWQTSLLLKSGYYNYMYLYVPENSKVASADLIEGSHWETENRYTFFVYYKPDPSSYDRIIGFTTKYAFPRTK
ncbi:MAG: DUF5103 domain-containing protein [Bacteroidales bacterium]|nr:DUF5103 domain-containing protein [Bacteroidales bacterium]